MKKKHKKRLLDLIGDAIVEFNMETGVDNFEVTVRMKCNDGFVTSEFDEIKEL